MCAALSGGRVAVVRRLCAALCAAVWLALAALCPAYGQLAGGDLPTFDARAEDSLVRLRTLAGLAAAGRGDSARLGIAASAGVRTTYDEFLGTPSFIRSTDGVLQEALAGFGWLENLSAFIDAHTGEFGVDSRALDGCRIARDFVSRHSGVRHVTLQQQMNGRDIAGAELRVNFFSDGAIINVGSTLLALPDSLLDVAMLSEEEAVRIGAASVGIRLGTDLARVGETNGRIEFEPHPALGGAPSAVLAYFPISPVEIVPVWVTTVPQAPLGNVYEVTVDGSTGEVLHRWNRTAYAGTEASSYRVYTSDSPSPYSPGSASPDGAEPPTVLRGLETLVSHDPVASPNGWIDDGNNETLGNNVDAHTDIDGNDIADLPRPAGSPYRVFDFGLNLGLDPSTYRNASVTQLFYWTNLLHDRFYQLGFDEASGNFQQNNFGRGGLGNDRLQADAQDGSGLNNANFFTPPDGTAPRMQMFIFTGPTPDRDASFDTEVVIHEYGHGVSNRLHGGLTALQSRGMGEGWSDFYALSLLSASGDDPNGNYAFGAYAAGQLAGLQANYYFGIRRYPYSNNHAANPLTFADIDPLQLSLPPAVPRSPVIVNTADSVHNMGEVWCAALWACRAALIDRLGVAGNEVMLQLVTDGMKLSPLNPTFIDARDAILQADYVLYGGAHHCELWAGFASRGLGVSAASPGASTTIGVIEAFDVAEGVCLNGEGTVRFALGAYRCDEIVQIVLEDTDLSGSVDVDVESDGGDSETVTLIEMSAGAFEGFLPLTSAPPWLEGDGSLHVADGGAIIVTYFDSDTGEGESAIVSDYAVIDCAAPEAVNVTSSSGAVSAVITLETSEEAAVGIRYGFDCEALDFESAVSNGVSHSIPLSGLPPETRLYFVVALEDGVGNIGTDDNDGACYSFDTTVAADYFTEQFDDGDNDLEGLRLVFVPTAGPDRYAVCRESISAFAYSTESATRIFLSDDDYERVDLTGEAVWLYGVAYSTFYVSSNGYITFGAGDFDRSETLAEHFALPRIAALYDDLNPGIGGVVSTEVFEDAVVMTYDGVPEFVNTGSNRFQIEMRFDGSIAISYVRLDATDGIAGLSPGGGMPADFVESDLGEAVVCSAPPPSCADGDVDGNGAVTPSDAQQAFLHYLGMTHLSDCALSHGDVADVGAVATITPADALCIFENYLGRPSCIAIGPGDCGC